MPSSSPRACAAGIQAGTAPPGGLLVLSGLGGALTGAWLTLFLPHPADTGNLLPGIRLVVGGAVIACIVLGFAAIRRRDMVRHRAWMIRAYAIAMGAGTQALTQLPVVIAAGPPAELPKALAMATAWLINLAAEWIIRRHPARGRSDGRSGSAGQRLQLDPEGSRGRDLDDAGALDH